MRVLVTGATGFIGRFLTPRLVTGSNTAVTLLLRESRSGKPLPPELAPFRPQFDVVYADLRNFQLTARAVREARPETVIHLAAAGVTNPFLNIHPALRHNLEGTLNLLRACFQKPSGIKQLIIARTPGELSAMNTYAASKAAAWTFCQMFARTQKWPVTGAMIFQAYGPGQSGQNLVPSAIQAALAGQDFPMTSGTQERDWIYVEDVISGIMAMYGRELPPGTTIDLGTGKTASVAEVVSRIYELAGGPGRPRPGLLPDRPGEVSRQVADKARTKALIGWQTAVSLPQGLAKTIETWRMGHSCPTHPP